MTGYNSLVHYTWDTSAVDLGRLSCTKGEKEFKPVGNAVQHRAGKIGVAWASHCQKLILAVVVTYHRILIRSELFPFSLGFVALMTVHLIDLGKLLACQRGNFVSAFSKADQILYREEVTQADWSSIATDVAQMSRITPEAALRRAKRCVLPPDYFFHQLFSLSVS